MKRQAISTTRLAKICGVSQGTVDRALNGRGGISEKTKERILAAAKSAIAYLLDDIKPAQPIPHRIVKRGSI